MVIVSLGPTDPHSWNVGNLDGSVLCKHHIFILLDRHAADLSLARGDFRVEDPLVGSYF